MTEIDEMDSRIMGFLLREGPVPNVVIAEALETSEATVRRRRARLESEGFIKFVCTVDPLKIGYESAAIVGIKALTSRITAVEAELKALDGVQFLGLSTGGYDLMLEVWLRSQRDIATFASETLASVEGITHVDIFVLTRLSKYTGWSGVFRS